MRSDARDQIIDLVRKLIHHNFNKSLPLYGVVRLFSKFRAKQKPKNLSEFTTSKKDLKKGISRIPLEMARIKDENEDLELQFNITSDDTENFNAQMEGRTSSYNANSIP